ncbi:actin interacting protein 3-domain-containing protein [Syncephalastrum racemosum]|uniref:Actin interacting protein 3-domain-containing protein n=1 Tax=Syncephalastrum racemosum TaxID=13706 RepID=A0A1X2H7J2_SYNRA|nr:actin interacting protein 3-domain-containing protein [Syncephalastrum racemosum]
MAANRHNSSSTADANALVMERSVTRLLATTKKLLHGLTEWSNGQTSQDNVRKIQSELETHLDEACQALEQSGRDMSMILGVPAALQSHLDDMLACEATPASLEEHLPGIRDIILKLLESLKMNKDLKPLQPRPRPRPRRRPDEKQKQAEEACEAALHALETNTQAMGLGESPPKSASPTRPPRARPPSASITPISPHAPLTPPPRRRPVSEGMVLFLKRGDQVKKYLYDTTVPVTLTGLHEAFASKYDGVMRGTVWIADPATRVMYELEDMRDVLPHTMLELRESQHETMSEPGPDTTMTTDAATVPLREAAMEAPSEKETVLAMKARINDLLQDMDHLRRISSAYEQETHDLIAKLRYHLSGQQQTAKTGKKRQQELQERCVAITQQLQECQDTVEELKLDVTQRRCRPSSAQLDHCQDEVNRLLQELSDLRTDTLTKTKPQWKAEWEAELQAIVSEQRFLKESEGWLQDADEDLQTLLDVVGQLRKVAEIQERQKPHVQGWIPKHDDDMEEAEEVGFDSVLRQLETVEVDHERRVKALQRAEKMRARELASRTDDFEKELSAFVDNKRLKQTGGAEMADQLRKHRDQQILKQLYQNNNDV